MRTARYFGEFFFNSTGTFIQDFRVRGFALIREFLCTKMTKKLIKKFPIAGGYAIVGFANAGVHCK